jgi:hypothetical protein
MRYKCVLVVMCVFACFQANANLLTNGGAEIGTLANWTAAGVSNPGIDDGSFDAGINPHTGKFAFFGGSGAWGSLTQNVGLSNVGQSREMGVSFWERGLDQDTSDDGYVSLTYHDAKGNVLSAQSSSEMDFHDGVWGHYRGTFQVPLDAASVDYTMNFVRHFGIDLDAFIDDNALTLTTNVPEPSTIWLTLAGLGLMGSLLGRTRVKTT